MAYWRTAMGVDVGEELRSMFHPEQLVQLDKVRGVLLADPAALDNRKKNEETSNAEGNTQSGIG
jgi:hypothetical protein